MRYSETTYRVDNVECYFYKDKNGSLFVKITIEIEGKKIVETVDGKTWNALRSILALAAAREKKNLFPFGMP